MWTLPLLILVTAIVVSIPLSRYMAWILDGRYRAPGVLRWFEARLNSGPQDWKQYTVALLVFNVALFVFGFVVLSLQPLMPLNPLGRGMLAPSTIFNTVVSFIDQHKPAALFG
jgi:K+-transporting ATPase ATPase A chain